ncbi:MAG: hypothetical protein U9R11_04170 [Chloroflexota bacterium]|nr:hypothetical protein [Chloroflexota bacterium]
MYHGFSSEQLKLSPEQERMLRELTIEEDGPGTILRDFEALLGFLKERQVQVTSKLYLLPFRVLPEITARMVHPLQLVLKRP